MVQLPMEGEVRRDVNTQERVPPLTYPSDERARVDEEVVTEGCGAYRLAVEEGEAEQEGHEDEDLANPLGSMEPDHLSRLL